MEVPLGKVVEYLEGGALLKKAGQVLGIYIPVPIPAQSALSDWNCNVTSI